MVRTIQFPTPPWDMDKAAAEWKDHFGRPQHAYGVQVLQFNESGEIERRFSSQEVQG